MKSTKRFKRMAAGAVFLFGMTMTSWTQEEICWQDRVLPLPQEMEVSGPIRVRAGDVGYTFRTRRDAPVYKTARYLLDRFARAGDGPAAVRIELALASETPEAIPAELRLRLKSLPNASQAYAMFTREGDPAGITIAANTPAGLLYGTRTLSQLVKAGDSVEADTQLVLPRVRIVDWPDVAYRGSRETASYNSFGWNSQWKFNLFCPRLTTWRNGNTPFGAALPPTEIRYLADIDSDRFRAWVRWAREIGFIYMPGIDHLGHMAPTGLAGISPAVYTDEHPAPANPKARGFCWARGQEIYTVLEEEMRKARFIAEQFPRESRTIEALLTEHTGTSCYCPECAGKSGYLLETEAILRIFARLKAEVPSLKLKLTLSQGSRPVNDQILERLSRVPDVGAGYYDGIYTYRTDRRPIIPEDIEAFARSGRRVDVVMTLMPGRWDVQAPGSLPQYVRTVAQEFAEKHIQSASHYDMVGAQYYYPLTMAAWGEYLWNADGRSVPDFARAYATITNIADPELFARWADKAGEAALELGVSQYLMNVAGGRYTILPDSIEEDEPQTLNTIRLDKALRDAKDAVMLARMADEEVMLWESEYTLAAVKFLALQLEIQEAMQSPETRDQAARLLGRLDRCARVAAAAAHAWHEHAAETRRALAEAPGYIRPPELVPHLPWGRDLGRVVPHRTQWRPWYGLLRASDTERLTASLYGITDDRGVFSPVELSEWEPGDFVNGQAVINLDLTPHVRPSGGTYMLGFQVLEGSGSTIGVLLTGLDRETGKTRVICSTRLWGMTGTRAKNSFYDYLVSVPDRGENESWNLTITLKPSSRGTTSAGIINVRRVWDWEEIPEEAIDRLLEE